LNIGKTLAKLPNYIQQPGPAGAAYISATSRLIELDFDIPAGVSLHKSLGQKIKSFGLTGAYFRIVNAGMSQLEYVIPAHSPDDDHVAWYSETYTPEMPGRIEDAGVNCGSSSEQAFYHIHGLWSDANGETAMGHLLPEASVVSSKVRVTGFGLKDARFNRIFDQQTGFDLFVPEQINAVPSTAQAILLRISPNTEISEPLIECCQKAGWSRASVHGVGSIIGAHFADGRVMKSFATEFLITKGEVDLNGTTPICNLEIAIVGLDGAPMQGLLKPKSNPVLVTSEIILKIA